MEDVPGSLAKLLNMVAGLKANVLHIYHYRSVRDIPLYVTHVELEMETRSSSHVNEVVDQLQKAGYDIKQK